jgi:response regulator of citrate/malate metabolism
MLFVTEKKYLRDTAKLRREVGELRLIVRAAIGAKKYDQAVKTVDKMIDDNGLDSINLEYEDLHNPILDDNKLPSRSEYNDRVETAIKMFQDRHPVSEVAIKLAVAKKTARRYLKIAVAKRKIKKADYDDLNV